MDAQTELQECIKNMTEEAVLKLFEAAEKMMLAEEGRIDSHHPIRKEVWQTKVLLQALPENVCYDNAYNHV